MQLSIQNIFSFLLVALEAFRNKHDALNYVASGGKDFIVWQNSSLYHMNYIYIGQSHLNIT